MKELSEHRKKYLKEYREKNREKILLSKKEYRKKNSDKIKEYQKNYHESYYKENKNYLCNKVKEYSKNNRDKINEYYKKWEENNRERVIWKRLLVRSLRRLGTKKENSTINLLGYSANDLKKHLEERFQEGMSWVNYGEWHIDHIKPVCSFDKETHPSVVNNLNNLQPLWAKDNFFKGKKIL